MALISAAERYDSSDDDKTVDFEGSSASTLRVSKRAEAVAKAVGRRIRDLRQEKGWSQEALADEAGMHRTYV